jgi:Flp pilus assembly protein TadD
MFLTLTLLLAVIAAPATPELPPALQAPFEEGVAALKAERLTEAEAAFGRVLAQPGGQVAFVHNNLGIVYQRRGEHAKAAEQFRAAARLDPAYVAPRILLGTSLMALGRAGEAKAPLQQAVKLAPRDPLARQQLAQACERTDNPAGAVDQYRALRDLLPQDPEYTYKLGKAYEALSEWSLRQIRDVDKHSARLFQALGHNYRVQGKTELAVSAFERAIDADPKLPEVHLALAQIHMAEKRWPEARQEIERELALVPESAGARALQQRLSTLEPKSP